MSLHDFVKIMVGCVVALGTVVTDADSVHGGGEAMTAEAFLSRVCTPPGRECWATMSGTAEHRRRGEDTRSVSLYVGIRFTSINTVAQVLVDDSENYRVIQNYGDSPTTTVVTDAGADGKTILGDFGLRAEDLAMTFLFWQFVEEFPREKALGRPCRVFLLESPEKSERVRVFIDEQYFFPIRVEWFRRPPHGPTSAFEAKPYRTLEAESFRREEDFWMVGTLGLFGPGWRTKIQFDKCRGGYPENEPKEPVFRIPVRKSVDAPQND